VEANWFFNSNKNNNKEKKEIQISLEPKPTRKRKKQLVKKIINGPDSLLESELIAIL